MTRLLDLDSTIELLHPHKTLPKDVLARTDTHQYFSYVRRHYTPCLNCTKQLECPPCPYNPPTEESP